MVMRRSVGLWLGVLALIGVSATSCGSAGRNCLVIPAQIELVQERREAALKELENKARQVDRMRASLERSAERLEELQAEKALLDQIGEEK